MNLRTSAVRRNRLQSRSGGRLSNHRIPRLEALEDRLLLDASDPTKPPGFIDPTAVKRLPEPPGPDETGMATADSTLSYGYLASLATGTGPGPAPSVSSPIKGLTGFDGLNANDNPFLLSPPDSIGAAGPNSYIETVNITLRIYQKSGTPITPVTDFGSFFSSLGGIENFSDPVVVYNDITQRFFISILDYAGDFSNCRLDVAISKSPNPTTLTSADWSFSRDNLQDGSFVLADYPKVGYGADGYVISTNQYLDGTFYNNAAILAITNDGTAVTPTPVTVPGDVSNFTLAPARMHSSAPGSPMWYVETPGSAYNAPGNQITVVREDNPFSASPTFTFDNLDVASYLGGVDPLGGNTGLGTRMYFSALRTVGGVTHLVAADAPGISDASGTRDRVRWYDINVTSPASPALIQEGQINPGPGIDTYFPDADINASGRIGLNYSQSIPFGSLDPRAGFMDMFVTGRIPGDAAGTMQAPSWPSSGQRRSTPSAARVTTASPPWTPPTARSGRPTSTRAQRCPCSTTGRPGSSTSSSAWW